MNADQIAHIKANLPEVVSKELHAALTAWYAWDGVSDEFQHMGLCNQPNRQLWNNTDELKDALPHNMNSAVIVTKAFPFNTGMNQYKAEKVLKKTHQNPYRRFWVECMLELPIKEESLYYVWAEGSCDNCTPSFDTAVQWADEFAKDDYSDVYVQQGETIVYRAAD